MAIDLYEEFEAVIQALDDAAVPYAVVGAMALAIHGVPRATEDIDIMILADDVERAREAVKGVGYTAPAAPMTFASGVTVHRVSKFHGKEFLMLDLLVADGPLKEIWETRIEVQGESRSISTVSTEGLVRMKSLSGRLKDLADIERLNGGDE